MVAQRDSAVSPTSTTSQGFLDGDDYIGKYAYFGPLIKFPGGFNTKNRLISSSGSITALGKQYIGE